jgi:DNA (cytosine-5)-methyltransferase 1
MRFGSLCSGIEGATVAWRTLGWVPAWYAEIEPFCCALLKQRYPTVENLGDVTQISSTPAIDLLVGGTPCQSFSIQGLRAGMADPRGNLTLRYCQIADSRRPRWVVWENVPGVLTSGGGRDFSSFVSALVELGYGVAWRVLDARYFGVPQRRRRVYVVGHYRSWQPAAAVLFDSPSCTANGRAAKEISGESESGVSRTVNGTLCGWSGDETPKFGVEVSPTLRAYQGGEGVGIVGHHVYRRLSALEWERLQGFPDGYTKVECDGAEASQRARCTALGNAFCVPVIRWIGERIQYAEAGTKARFL